MGRKRKGEAINGWLIVDKPSGPTSNDVVGRVRRLTNAQKVGHAGTLDPMATGVLPLALGEATKTLPYVVDRPKRYRFTVRWGQATSTDDAEGEVVETSEARPAESTIREALAGFVGEIEQTPPIFSAVKVDGMRAYDLARRDEPVALAPRVVTIERFELEAIRSPDLADFVVDCGKGTYMRALARDLGQALGCLGHVVALRRTTTAGFSEDDAISLDRLEALGHSPAALEQMLPVEAGLDDIPALDLTEMEASRLRSGQGVSMLARAKRERALSLEQGGLAYAVSAGRPVAIVRYQAGELRPIRVLNL